MPADLNARHLVLRLGAREMARTGSPVGRRHVDLDLLGIAPFTFARADASPVATYIDRGGVIRTAPAGKLRLCYLDLNADGIAETAVLLLEDTSRNDFVRSEELENASWSKNTSMTVSANADVAPDGQTTADRLVEAAINQEQVAWQTMAAFTADVKHALSTHAKAGTRSWIVMTIRDVNANTNAVLAWFNLATGAIGTVTHNGVGSGEAAFIERLGGYYRCILVGACNNADTTPLGTIGLATGNGVISYLGDGASYVTLWGSQFENNRAMASSYIKTVASGVTRAADAWDILTSLVPESCTVYLKFVELGTQRMGPADGYRLWKVPGTGSPALWIQASNNNAYNLNHHNGATQVTGGVPSACSIYDTVELVAQLDPSGKPQLFQSKNGGAWETSGPGGAAALAAAWAAGALSMNSQGGTLVGRMGLINLLWARSVLVDPDTMRIAAAA